MREPISPLKADGNLGYLDFLRLLQFLWSRAHPDVPLVPYGNATASRYPCVVYSLEIRRPFKDEGKMRQREVIMGNPGDRAIVVKGQKFTNFVKFTAVDEVEPDGAQVVEELIEAFEDFLLYHTGILKRLGLAELTYNRRLPDDEQSRPGEGIVERALVYTVVTEKLLLFEVDKLESIYIEAVQYLTSNQATPSTVESDGDVTVVITDNQAGQPLEE